MYTIQWLGDSYCTPPDLAVGSSSDVLELMVDGLLGRRPFQAALASLMPPNQPLHSLSMSNSRLMPPLDGCPALGAVTELWINRCTSPVGSFSAALEALLPQAPQLRHLTVQACLEHDDPFPESLRNATGLSHLCLAGNDLDALPEGPCWAGGCQLAGNKLAGGEGGLLCTCMPSAAL